MLTMFHWQPVLLVLLNLLIMSQSSNSCEEDEVSVRLVNGTSERNGRVEMCWNHQWKAVCDSGWDQAEANTVCRELGYLNSNGNVIPVTGSHFGGDRDVHLLIQWSCGPTDTILAYCSKSTARQPCSPSETAGVYCQGQGDCQDGEVRLMNGSSVSSYEGRVEICFSGVWGTICSDGWDSREATVVCRQLGVLVQQFAISLSSSDAYGKAEGPILLDRMNCDLNDTRLAECARHYPSPGMVGEGCTHRKDAGVICRGGSNCRDGEIRLVLGQSQNEGMVEICFGGVWGTICDDGWDDSDSRVACKQLGYIQGHAIMNTENSREIQLIQHLSHVKCTGQESRLMDCSHEGIGVHTCGLNSNENVAIECLAPQQTTTFFKEQVRSTIASSSITAQTVSNNTRSVTSLAGPIIAGSICFGTIILLAMIVLIPMAMVFVKRSNILCSNKSTQQGTIAPLYEEITTNVESKLEKADHSCMDVIKTEENLVDDLYLTKEAAISTSFNDAYGYLHRQQLYGYNTTPCDNQ